MKVDLHIDRLIVEGASPADGRLIGTALQQELGRLITEGGLPGSWGGAEALESADIPHLDAGSVRLGKQPRPRALGRQLALQVYGGSRS